jgi:hypothetical protein
LLGRFFGEARLNGIGVRPDDSRPDFVSTQMPVYWRPVAEAQTAAGFFLIVASENFQNHRRPKATAGATQVE